MENKEIIRGKGQGKGKERTRTPNYWYVWSLCPPGLVDMHTPKSRAMNIRTKVGTALL